MRSVLSLRTAVLRAHVLSGVALIAFGAAQPAIAADAAAAAAAATDAGNAEAIVVTGSRIPRAGFDTVQPAVVLGAPEIAARGYTNIAQALQELPAFGPPGASPVGSQSNFGAGQSFVDFFSLGSQRTLTLVNGRRFVSSNTASIFGPTDAGSQVDFNTIPTLLVDRVETIAVGGAPIYGSDAIAGTVNIILKKSYDGIAIDAQTGLSQAGDGGEFRLSGIAGRKFADGRGSIVVSAEYNRTTGIPTSDRFLTGGDGPFFTTASDPGATYAQQLYYKHRYNVFTNTGTPLVADSIPEFAGVTNAQGQVLTFDLNGRLVPLDFGTRTGSLIESSGGNGFNIADYGNLLTSSERYLGTVQANYDVNDHITLFGEGWYSHSSATNLRDQPVYNTTLFGPTGSTDGDIVININNPFLNAADRAIIQSNIGESNTFELTRANTDLSSGSGTSVVELYRFVGGARGDFELGSRKVTYEVSANYGSSTTRSSSRELIQKNFLNAVDAVTDANGNIVCRPGYTSATIASVNSACAPLNLFGLGQRSQAALDYVTAIAHPVSKDTQLVLNANLQSTLFRLPAGDLGFSIGYEHRRESTSFDPGAFYRGEANGDGTYTQYGRSIPIDPISGSFKTDEVFGEVRIPIISPDMNLPLLYRVELEGAARYVHNSLSGGDLTWTAGGKYQPVEDLVLRGNYTRAIRAPAITEAFNPTSRIFDSGKDPCDARYVNAGPNPANRAANCAAAGIAQPFQSNYSDFTIPATVSGNPGLTNEKAYSFTVGAVIRPRFIPGLTVSVDYINIKLRNAIVSLGGDDILNACYDRTGPANSFCALLTRDATGQLTFIKEGYYNAAKRDFAGISTEVAYRLGLDRLGLGANAGNLGLSVNYFYVDKLVSQTGTGDQNIIAGGIGNPKHSFTANVNYDNGGLSSLVQVQYTGTSKIDPNAALTDYQYPRLAPFVVVNSSIGYETKSGYSMRLIVDNLFDVKPPFPSPAGGGTVTYYSGILGRYFRIQAGVKFK